MTSTPEGMSYDQWVGGGELTEGDIIEFQEERIHELEKALSSLLDFIDTEQARWDEEWNTITAARRVRNNTLYTIPRK